MPTRTLMPMGVSVTTSEPGSVWRRTPASSQVSKPVARTWTFWRLVLSRSAAVV